MQSKFTRKHIQHVRQKDVFDRIKALLQLLYGFST